MVAPQIPQGSFQRRVEKPWGWEEVWAETDAYTGKTLHILTGHRTSLQYHDRKQESQCLLRGRALLELEDKQGRLESVEMEPGRGYTISPFRKHRLTALEDAEVVEVSTPEVGTTFRVEDDYNRDDETEATRQGARQS